jgi:hypothetical protein
MKTRKFVAEILWLFLGLCVCPQCTEQTHDIEQRGFQPILGEQDNLLMERWYRSALIRPPPRQP